MSASGSGVFAKLTSYVVPPDDEEAPRALDGAASARAASLWTRAREATGLQLPRAELVDQVCPSMTFKQRLYAFCICFCVSLAVSVTSMFSMAQLLAGHPAPFAIKCVCHSRQSPPIRPRPLGVAARADSLPSAPHRYTIGNIMSILSTGFIIGPKRQINNMTNPTRAISAGVYLLAMVATLFSALALHKALLVLVCILVQFGAMAWYILSYIPFGRRMATNFANSFL